MTTRINTITSDTETAFSTIPNGVTALTSDTSLKLATTSYVQANMNSLSLTYLRRNTDQTLNTGTAFNFSPGQSITNVDTINIGDTLVCGEIADSNISIGQSATPCQIFIKTYLQPISSIFKFWGNGCTLTSPAGTGVSLTSIAVQGKKILSGSFAISLTSTPITFSPVFTSKPVVILCVRSISTAVLTNVNRWVTGVGTDGFIANTTTTNINLIMNWFAIGD